jgi:hypothetical protein
MAQVTRRKILSTHHELTPITEKELREDGPRVLGITDQGIQAIVVGEDLNVRTVVGLNGCRYLPNPDPDPLDEILRLVLDSTRSESK